MESRDMQLAKVILAYLAIDDRSISFTINDKRLINLLCRRAEFHNSNWEYKRHIVSSVANKMSSLGFLTKKEFHRIDEAQPGEPTRFYIYNLAKTAFNLTNDEISKHF